MSYRRIKGKHSAQVTSTPVTIVPTIIMPNAVMPLCPIYQGWKIHGKRAREVARKKLKYYLLYNILPIL